MDQHANEHDDAVESTPLLVDEAESEAMDGADVEQRQRDESTSAADARSAKIALRLHTAALTIGIITLGLVIGILIVLGFRLTPPDYERPWLVERSAGDIVFSVVCSIVLSLTGLVRWRRYRLQMPQFVSAILHPIVGGVICFYAGEGLDGVTSHQGYCYYGPPEQERDCERFATVFYIVSWFYVVSAFLLGFANLGLFIQWVIVAYRKRSERGGSLTRWTVPTGQLTFEFTIKLLRQETRNDADSAGRAQDV